MQGRWARASGSAAILLSTLIGGGQALIKLPSGLLRLCSVWLSAWAGRPHFSAALARSNRSAGYYRRLGHTPHVRGTVKNPNDHPHGGRTRAIKCPLTPWGLVTKKSRQPKKVPKLKVLFKRLSNKQRLQTYLEAEEKRGRLLFAPLAALAA